MENAHNEHKQTIEKEDSRLHLERKNADMLDFIF